jgi:hypothetical protein
MEDRFGSCCTELGECLTVESSFFRREDNGVWFLTVGYISTPNGPGFFDQALFYCPFCGAKVQDEAVVASKDVPPRD